MWMRNEYLLAYPFSSWQQAYPESPTSQPCCWLPIWVFSMIETSENGDGSRTIHIWCGFARIKKDTHPPPPPNHYCWDEEARCPLHLMVFSPRWWHGITIKLPGLLVPNSFPWVHCLRPWWFWDAWDKWIVNLDKWTRGGLATVAALDNVVRVHGQKDSGTLMGKHTLPEYSLHRWYPPWATHNAASQYFQTFLFITHADYSC